MFEDRVDTNTINLKCLGQLDFEFSSIREIELRVRSSVRERASRIERFEKRTSKGVACYNYSEHVTTNAACQRPHLNANGIFLFQGCSTT
jgi:hypothetical protein